jgi:DNA-binding transcriptional ArsR family regulator
MMNRTVVKGKKRKVYKLSLPEKISMKLEDNLIEDAHVLLHPIRFRIVELLMEKPMHINGISKALAEERRLVSYHLLALEECGFVNSRYEISQNPKSKGKAIRKYWVTEKVNEVIAEIKKKL